MQAKLLIAVLLMVLLSLLIGCGHNPSGTAATDDHAAVRASAGASGAQLWADNCARCHNIRPPQSYSDAQWEAVVMHMRLRADLTGPEQRKITEFLQASH
jgi:hypothetical protein